MPTGQYAIADVGEKKPIGAYHVDDVDTTAEAPSSKGGLVLAAAGKAIPKAAALATELATNPNVPRLASKVGQAVAGITTLGAAGAKALSGDPIGAAYTAAATAPSVWAGGKVGWFSGKLAQQLSAPVAAVLEKAAPYAQTLSTLSGAQGALDLAQMAAPQRRDIGFLGIGSSSEGTPTLKEPKAQLEAVKYFVDTKGLPPSVAVARVTGGDVRLFGPLMTAYMRARMK